MVGPKTYTEERHRGVGIQWDGGRGVSNGSRCRPKGGDSKHFYPDVWAGV